MAKVKKRTASTPGRKPSPLSYSKLLVLRVNQPMWDVLEGMGNVHTWARVGLAQWMLEKGHLKIEQLPGIRKHGPKGRGAK
jgi:hypothetical protein